MNRKFSGNLLFTAIFLFSATFFFILAEKNDAAINETQRIVNKYNIAEEYEIPQEIPFLDVVTDTQEDPPFHEAERWGSDQGGDTVTGNDYIDGKLYVYQNGDKQFQEKIKIRVRGNSSTIYSPKAAYHIKLNKRFPLLGDDYGAYSDWVLLSYENYLRTYVGDTVGKICGLSLQPEMAFVNVRLNGDWKGCYCLTTPVNKTTAGQQVTKNGFILEDTIYWWNDKRPYFRTKRQAEEGILGYTFKYPKIEDVEDERYVSITNYMQDLDNVIFSDQAANNEYQSYIDEESFAEWILAQDILGNSDGLGSNIYYFKEDFDSEDPFSSKLKMHLVWDMDGIFATEGEWSESRIEFFPFLFQQESFQKCYKAKWEAIEPTLYQTVENELNRLEQEEGPAIEQSWKMEASRWDGAPVDREWAEPGQTWDIKAESFHTQKENALNWFSRRIPWMDEKIRTGNFVTTVDNPAE